MGRAIRRGGMWKCAAATFVLQLLTLNPVQAIDENLTKGATHNHVFESGLWNESIDNLNGALALTIPLGPEYQVSADVSYQVKVAYSSKIWQMNSSNILQGHRSRLWGRGQAGLGFALHLGRYYLNAATADCSHDEEVFEDPTGAVHEFSSSVTVDGSFLKRVGIDPTVLRTPSGGAPVAGPAGGGPGA